MQDCLDSGKCFISILSVIIYNCAGLERHWLCKLIMTLHIVGERTVILLTTLS